GSVFVDGLATTQRYPSDNACSQGYVVNVVCHHDGDGGNEERRVLIVGMQHDHDIGARSQRLPIARLLVSSVAVVAVVLEDKQPHAVRETYRLVGAVIIHQ